MPSYKYREVHSKLKSQILSGIYKEGDLLPSEKELVATHSLTRNMIRLALNDLEKEGYIIKKKGKGSVVNHKRKSLGLLSFQGFSSVLSEEKNSVKTVSINKPKVKKWENDFFYPLTDLEKGAGCIFLERLRYLGKNPVMLEYTYIPNLNLPRFCQNKFVNDSLFETLRVNYQIEIISVKQEVRAIEADDFVATQLQVKVKSPVLHIYRQYKTNRPELNLYSSLFCNTNNFSIGSEFS